MTIRLRATVLLATAALRSEARGGSDPHVHHHEGRWQHDIHGIDQFVQHVGNQQFDQRERRRLGELRRGLCPGGGRWRPHGIATVALGYA